MKQKDIALIIVVIFFSGVIAFLLTEYVLLPKKERKLTVQKVDSISSEFKEPDSKVFNPQAINPTKLIQIGDSSNQDPF